MVKANNSENKSDCRLPVGISTYDISLCTANCKTPCGRKGEPVEKIYTASDFADTCSSYSAREK